MDSVCRQALSTLPNPLAEYTGISSVDRALCNLVVFFSASVEQPVLPLGLAFISQLSAPCILVILECMRTFGNANGVTVSTIVGILYQTLGGGVICTLFWLWHVLQYTSNYSKAPMLSNRAVQSSMVGIVFGLLLPSMVMFLLPTPGIIALWQPFPVWVGLIQCAFLAFPVALKPALAPHSRTMQVVFGLLVIQCTACHWMSISMALQQPHSPLQSLINTFGPRLTISSKAETTIPMAVQQLLKWDLISIFGSTLLAILWTTEKSKGDVWNPYLSVLGLPLLGPGTVCLMAWKHREEKWNTQSVKVV